MESGSAYFAGFVMFTTSLVMVSIVVLARKPVRSATADVFKALYQRRISRKLLFAGPIGAFVSIIQATVIATTGTSFYSVAFVLGQIAGGAAFDSPGVGMRMSTAERRRRIAGILIALLSVTISILGIGAGKLVAVIVPLLFVIIAGVLMTGQHVLNSAPTILTGRPEPAALLTYLLGTGSMIVIMALLWPIARPTSLEPWFIFSGVLGPVVVLLAATLVGTLGAFSLSLGMIAGQMSGALVLDFLWPSQFVVSLGAVIAAALMIIAMLVTNRR